MYLSNTFVLTVWYMPRTYAVKRSKVKLRGHHIAVGSSVYESGLITLERNVTKTWHSRFTLLIACITRYIISFQYWYTSSPSLTKQHNEMYRNCSKTMSASHKINLDFVQWCTHGLNILVQRVLPCLKKTVQNCFCQNFVKFPPILIIFGRNMAKRLKLCKVHSFSTSPNSRHHTTVLNATVPNCYTTLLKLDCSHLHHQFDKRRHVI